MKENNSFATELSELNAQIELELTAFSDNVSSLTEAPDKATYSHYCRHLDYIQDLFDQAGRIDRQTIPDRNSPTFYETLKMKERFRQNEASFRLFRGSFLRKYQEVEKEDDELVRSIEPEEPHPIIEELIPEAEAPAPSDPAEEEFLSEQEAMLQEALAEAEAKAEKEQEKKEKAKKEREKAKKRAQADAKHQAMLRENEETLRRQHERASSPDEQFSSQQYDRQEEAARLGLRYAEGKTYTEAELITERNRQRDAEDLAKQLDTQRSEDTFRTLSALRDRERIAAEQGPLEKGHIDFSHDLYRDISPEPSDASTNTHDAEEQSISYPQKDRSTEKQTHAENPASISYTAPSQEPFVPKGNAPVSEHSSDVSADREHNADLKHPESIPHHPASEYSADATQRTEEYRYAQHPAQDPRTDHTPDAHTYRSQDNFASSEPELQSRYSTPEYTAAPHNEIDVPQQGSTSAAAYEHREQFARDEQKPITNAPKHQTSGSEPGYTHPVSGTMRYTQGDPTENESDRSRHPIGYVYTPDGVKESHIPQVQRPVTTSNTEPAGHNISGRPSITEEPAYDSHTRQNNILSRANQESKKPTVSTPFDRPHTEHMSSQTKAASDPVMSSVGQKTSPLNKSEEASERTHYSFVPGGTREDPHFALRNRPSGDNKAIYASIQKGMSNSAEGPMHLSAAYLSQMQWNVNMARINYQDKRGTKDAVTAAHAYRDQREVMQSLRKDIREGRVKLIEPKAVSEGKTPSAAQVQSTSAPQQPRTQYSYVPNGVSGVTINQGGQVTSSMLRRTRQARESFAYTPEKPLKVSPAYEAAMLRRLSEANAAIDTAIELKGGKPPKINEKTVQELMLSQDAYEAFRRAKQAGTVVVTPDAKVSKPNYRAWQQRKQANVFGTTFSSKQGTINRARKEAVEEVSASILYRGNSKLKAQRVYNRHVSKLVGKAQSYGSFSRHYIAQKTYELLQSGEDNPIRTFDHGRHYLVTGYGITQAVRHGNLIRTGKKIDKLHAELDAFHKSNDVLFAEKFGEKSIATSRSLSKEIKALKERGKTIKEKINILQAKGSALTIQERTLLKELIGEKKKIGIEVRELLKLKGERRTFDLAMLKRKAKIKTLNRDMQSVSGGLYSLRTFVLRPLREGSETGAQGVGTALRIATNRNVHYILKHAFSAATKVVPHTAAFLLTGDVQAANHMVNQGKMAINAVKTSVKTQIGAAKQATKEGAKVVGTVTKRAAKNTVSAITPKPVKHGVHYVTGAVRDKYAVAVGIKNKVFQKFWASNAGKSVTAVSRFTKGFSDALRLGISALKAVGIKVLVGFLAFIVLIMILSSAVSLVGGSTSGVIMSPESDSNDKVNLAPYYNILLDEWNLYMDDLKSKGEDGGYYKTTVNMDAKPGNIREMLSMMAVRMSQDLDLDANPEIEPYLRSLLRDMNPKSEVKGTCYCKGKNCKSRKIVSDCDVDCPVDCEKNHYYIEKYCDKSHKTLTITVESMHFGALDQIPDPVFNLDNSANEGATAIQGGLIGKFTITYYCAEKYPHICNAGPPYKTAIGSTPTVGRTIAVDKNKIPLRSQVIIDGHTYTAEDTGGAVDGNHIDILVATHEEALNKGTRKNVPVYSVGYEGEGVQTSGEWNGWTNENQIWAKNICNGGVDWSEAYSGIPNVTDVIGNETNLDGVTLIGQDRENKAIVNIAKSQIGNVGGKPYWSWYGYPSRVEWCATFVSWCANQNGVLNKAIPKFASCSQQGVPWFKEHGQWAKPGDITPAAGDIIFFDWEQDGRPDHVGIVVGSDGKKVYTVEGNSRDQVRAKSYALNSELIFGYGIPNY